jgi:hypothetical protein
MLVLKKFEVNPDAETFLEISGREAGILSFFLSLIGLDPITSFVANRESVKYETVSVKKGKSSIMVPNTAITAVVTGYRKPFELLISAAVILVLGITLSIGTESGLVAVAGVIVAVICVVLYILKKFLFFGFYNGGDHPIAAMSVKRSVIENMSLDLEKFEDAAILLNKVILETKK